MSRLFVSVVIPVLDDSMSLRKCLQVLKQQTYPKDCYEIIVVDNGSKEDIKNVVSEFKNTVFTYEEYPTLHAARNKGISIAKGEILAFTDADCIPALDWIEKGVNALENNPGCGLVAGKVEIFFKDPNRPTAAELFEKITAFRQKEYIERWHFAAPANAFTTKSIIEKVGLFDGTLKSGADVEWGNRIFKAGYRQIYASDAYIQHPARQTLKQVLSKHARVVGGLYDIRKKKDYPFKQFIADLKDDWPGFNDCKNAFLDKRVNSNTQRAKVLAVCLLVKSVRFFEMIRLRSGAISRRR